MGVSRKGLYRLALLILLIPISILLVLHFFGENRMVVEMNVSLKDCNLKNESVTIHLSKSSDLEISERNQLSRVEKTLSRKRVSFDDGVYPCFGDTLALLMIDKKNNLRGSYVLEHSDINRLFVELDIIMLQEIYGEEVSR